MKTKTKTKTEADSYLICQECGNSTFKIHRDNVEEVTECTQCGEVRTQSFIV